MPYIRHLLFWPRCGHRPVALLGGATGRVGDPSGRSTERPVLSEEEIERNVQGVDLRRGGAGGGGEVGIFVLNAEVGWGILIILVGEA